MPARSCLDAHRVDRELAPPPEPAAGLVAAEAVAAAGSVAVAADEMATAGLVAAEAGRWLRGGCVGLSHGAPGGGPTVVAEAVPGGPAAVLSGVPAGWSDLGGLPTGCAPVAAGRVLALAARAAARSGSTVEVDGDAVTATLLLPLVVAAATGTAPAARPPEPRPTADGAVCADLGAEGDREAFDRLLEVLGPAPVGSEELAERAQEWRLPVTPYRRRPRPVGAGPRPNDPDAGADMAAGGGGVPSETGSAGWPPLAGVIVVDLTVMWSGPLCTALLAALGARVLKVEPDCRPDGTRSSPGGALFRALNPAKERVALDLRRPDQRDAFFDLVAGADLVVDNFSPRVVANLGIDEGALRAVNPRISVLHLPAFPPGPQRQWVSYGTGVHAVSGLGEVTAPAPGPGTAGRAAGGPAAVARFAAPAVTYPDPLGGLAGAATALALLGPGHNRGRAPTGAEPPGVAEVSLADAVAPLLQLPDRGSLTTPLDPSLVGRLVRRFGPVPPAPLAPLDVPASPPPPRRRFAGSTIPPPTGKAGDVPAGGDGRGR